MKVLQKKLKNDLLFNFHFKLRWIKPFLLYVLVQCKWEIFLTHSDTNLGARKMCGRLPRLDKGRNLRQEAGSRTSGGRQLLD